MKHEFEQKKWEKLPLFSIRFKVNYWILKKIGLVFFGILAKIWAKNSFNFSFCRIYY